MRKTILDLGSTSVGEWKDNKKHGKGTWTYYDGSGDVTGGKCFSSTSPWGR